MQRRGEHRQNVKRRRMVKVKARKTRAANISIDQRKKHLLERHGGSIEIDTQPGSSRRSG